MTIWSVVSRQVIGHNVAVTQLTLRPMSDAEYEAFYSKLIREYAADNVEAGNWLEEDSIDLATKDSAALLPQGRETPKVLILSADNSDGETIGYVWIGLERHGAPGGGAWIYDIEVAESQRGKGYGRALLRAAEEVTAKNGVIKLGLNVFGVNTTARNLYESAGYSITQIQMSKKLGAAEDFE